MRNWLWAYRDVVAAVVATAIWLLYLIPSRWTRTGRES